MGYSSYTERLKNLKKELDERAAAKRQRQLNANRSECASEFIFIPQANTYLGFKALIFALEAGYRVRAGVSTPKSSSWFDEHPKLQRHFSRKTLEVVIMADLTQIHSYLEVLNGITGIIYNDGGVVTSSTGDSYIEEIVLPAFNFPIAVMNASILTPSVKRIIFTTVAEALVPWGEDPQISFKDSPLGMTVHTKFSSTEQACRGANTLCLQSVQKMVLRNDLSLVILLRAPMIGAEIFHSGTEVRLEVGNRIHNVLVGKVGNTCQRGAFVDTDDLVLCQVRALRTDVPGSTPSHPRAHILAADTPGEFEWESAKRFVANLLPREILDKYFPLTGSCATRPWRFDTSREKQFFSWQFKSFEECLGDLVAEHLWMRCLHETRRAEPSPILGPLQTWLHNHWSERCR